MKELKDIVLKKGDIIYFTDETWHIDSKENGKNFYDIFENDSDIALIKIERPVKYETIYQARKEILDKEEKEYLEAVIRPFKDRVNFIMLTSLGYDWQTFIKIDLDKDSIELPLFKLDTMYKGMELNKEYTLEELGLFKE